MSFFTAAEGRRSRYHLAPRSPITDEQLQALLERCIQNAPTAYNDQSGRVVLLKGEQHVALWQLTLETLRHVTPIEHFPATEKKIRSFAAAYGTVLFFEDQAVIDAMQTQYPLYARQFSHWSDEQTGILQYMVWTALSEAGLGANLQHYNPLIDEQVKERWNLPRSWSLMAQMPFGTSLTEPPAKAPAPTKEMLHIFG